MTASDEEMEGFYSMLQESIDNTQNRDITIVMGDFHAKIGMTRMTICFKCALNKRKKLTKNLSKILYAMLSIGVNLRKLVKAHAFQGK